MRSFDWEKPILGKLTATDFAEATAATISTAIMLTLLLLFGGG